VTVFVLSNRASAQERVMRCFIETIANRRILANCQGRTQFVIGGAKLAKPLARSRWAGSLWMSDVVAMVLRALDTMRHVVSAWMRPASHRGHSAWMASGRLAYQPVRVRPRSVDGC
jgi:hypothetical protein